MEYFDEQYEDYDDYDDYDGYEDDDDGCYERHWEFDDYYELEEPPSRWQRVKAWFNRLYWNIRYKLQPNLHDDIPF